MAHILIVEDETSTQQLLTELLEKEGHKITINGSGSDVLSQVRDASPSFDLLICDIVLPNGDGLAITREISVHGYCPVMLISTKDTEFDRVMGLAQGADDYLTKPFNPMEFVLRVQVILRRSQPNVEKVHANESIYVQVFEHIKLNVETKTIVFSSGEIQQLTDGELQLLLYFLGRRGKVCHRQHILSALMSRNWTPSDRSLDVLVGRLRRKLLDDISHPRLIITVRSKGYMLASVAT